jgi:hypothetical protein
LAIEPLTSGDPVEIAGYRISARLGAGGMGRVYLAFTPGGRPVALKVVRSDLADDEGFRKRFRREVEAAQRVHGLYTAQVLDADPAAIPPWLVTAYVPGPSLHQAIADHGPMPVQTVLLLTAGVAEALQAIHSVGVIHRDLKPSNVLLAQDGPRVIDFGIARAVEATALTHSDARIGSPQFMAPEQVRGLPQSPAIDVFALGSLAAYAVLGRSPFGGGDEAAILYRVAHEAPDLGDCPAALRRLVERCLAKSSADRPGPTEIIEFCRARTADGAVEFGQSWLPPAMTAAVLRHAAGPATAPMPVSAPADPILRAGCPPGQGRGRASRGRLIGGLVAAVILAALIGVGALALSSSDGGGAHRAGAGQRTRGTPASTSPQAPWFSGTWIGTASQPTGIITHWTVVLTLPATGTTGAFRFPSLGCSGTLIVTKSSKTAASVHEDVTSDPRGVCAPGGLMTLTKDGSDLMDMTWQDASDQANVGSGQLTGGLTSGG